MHHIIGGFFALEPPLETKTPNVLSAWDVPARPHLLFSNARSALNAFLRAGKFQTLWLPAYACAALALATEGASRVRFYPLTPLLSPDAGFLEREIGYGDAVLAIDYFGRNPDQEFLQLVAAFEHITWIEDRAQALCPADSPWGDAVLYSPRKLVGVPDGGIIVSYKRALAPVETTWNGAIDFLAPSVLRYEDQQERRNDQWHGAHAAREAALTASALGMSRLSREILAATAPEPLIRQRQANYAMLMETLAESCLFLPEEQQFAPFGFPLRVRDRQAVAAFLHGKGVFAAHHWPQMPSDPGEFPAEHALCEHMLTLPCDHRYNEEDMARVAALVRRAPGL